MRCYTKGSEHHNTTHGHSAGGSVSPTYRSWRAMLSRTRPDKAERWYEGVRVCKRWKHFENFLSDMGERPAGTTLDRVNSKRGYFPSNCRWATYKQQSRGKAKVSDVQAMIISKTKFNPGGQSALARELGVSVATISMYKLGRYSR